MRYIKDMTKITFIVKAAPLYSSLVVGILMINALCKSPVANAAGAASLSLSPVNINVGADKSAIVKVHLNTGNETVNVVQADVSYPLNIFDPTKSRVSCGASFPTVAQSIVNGKLDASTGLVKAACGVAATNGSATPFKGETDVATIVLHVRSVVPSVHNAKMLQIVTDSDLSDGVDNYSGVARAADSSNILGVAGAAGITITSKNNTYSTSDINNDKEINAQDISIFVTNFGLKGSRVTNPKTDLNHDNTVDIVDLSIMLSNQ
jgi:hypothetical protein